MSKDCSSIASSKDLILSVVSNNLSDVAFNLFAGDSIKELLLWYKWFKKR
jgi:hypothetical protein